MHMKFPFLPLNSSLRSVERLAKCSFPPVIAGIFLATPFLARGGVDSFDSPPYTTGNVIGQVGPTSIWTPTGSWQNQTSGPIAGAILPGGQLQITQTDASGGAGAAAITRQYNTVSLTSSYTIEFDLTLGNIDSIQAGGFNNLFGASTNAGDYLNLFDRANSGGDFGGDGTWLIRGGQFNSTGKTITNGAVSDSAKVDYDAAAPLDWYVFSYVPLTNNQGFGTAKVIDTGISLTAGTTYHFSITILGAGQWNLKLSNGTTTYDSSLAGSPFGFRSNAALPSGNMYFGYQDVGSNTDTLPGLVSMQLDNVSVVPEPSVFVLGGLGIAVAFAFRRRG